MQYTNQAITLLFCVTVCGVLSLVGTPQVVFAQEDTRPRQNVVTGELRQDPRSLIQALTEHINQNPKSAKFYVRRGDQYLKLKLYKEAFNDFDNAVGLEPHNTNALMSRGMINRILGRHTEALSDLNKVMQLDAILGKDIKNADDPPFSLMVEWEPQLVELDKQIGLSPKDPRLYFERGMVNKGTANYVVAVGDLTAAINLLNTATPVREHAAAPGGAHPIQSAAHAELMSFVTEGKNKLPPPEMRKAAMFQRCLCNYFLLNYAGARADIDELIKSDPGSESYWTTKGEIEQSAGNLQAALVAYDKACAIKPESFSSTARRNLRKQLNERHTPSRQ